MPRIYTPSAELCSYSIPHPISHGITHAYTPQRSISIAIPKMHKNFYYTHAELPDKNKKKK